jgi:hypothetical protein
MLPQSGCVLWMARGYEAGVLTRGLEGGVGCNPRVTFDGKCKIWGYMSSNLIPPHLRTTEPTSSQQSTVPAITAKLGGGSASISGTSVYRGSKRGRRVVRRPRRAKSDCPNTGDRGAALTLVGLE